MDIRSFRPLQGTILSNRFQLGKLVSRDDEGAVFLATSLESGDGGQNTMVRLLNADTPDASQKLNRFLEATFLVHPNILRHFTAGSVDLGDRRLIYVVTEAWDSRSATGVPPDTVLRLAEHMISALSYLHESDLVYCVLGVDTVVRVGSDWKLSDFSQLRVAGTIVPDELNLLESRGISVPPEGYSGSLLTSWDLWSFGALLKGLVAPPAGNAAALACRAVNPRYRPTLNQLKLMLRGAQNRSWPTISELEIENGNGSEP